MLSEEQQQFEGHRVLSSQESLKMAADIQKQWTQLGEEVLRRHRSIDGTPAPEHKVMDDMNNTIEQLCEQYRRRVEGENGVAKSLLAFSSSLSNVPMCGLKYSPGEVKESDWSNLYYLLPEWTAQAEKLLELIGSPNNEEKSILNANEKLDPEDVFRMLQHWVLNITSGTERDNAQLTQQVTSLHTAMVQYMVNVLILLSPDHSCDPTTHSDTLAQFGEDGEEEFASPVPVQNVQEQALDLSNKLHTFSSYIMGCCQDMVNISPNEDDGYELRQLQTIKSSCDEWIETCQLLLLKVTDSRPYSGTGPPPPTSMDEAPLASTKEVPKNTEEDGLTEEPPKGELHTKSTEVKRETNDYNHWNEGIPDHDMVKMIGYDGNIHKKSLREDEIAVTPESALQACRPTTPRSIQAFQSLTSLEQLEKRLLQAEMRAQKAEERSESLDEQLKAAMQKIQELEVTFHEDENKAEEISAEKEIINEQVHLPSPTKKRPKSSKVKHK